jgi:hypothetical protein
MILKMFLASTSITAQSRCRSKKVQMPKRVASQPLGVKTPSWWGDNSWNNPRSCKLMEQLISQKNTSSITIGRRPLMSLAIAINLLTPSIKVIDLMISPQATIVVTWNNSKNLESRLQSLSTCCLHSHLENANSHVKFLLIQQSR